MILSVVVGNDEPSLQLVGLLQENATCYLLLKFGSALAARLISSQRIKRFKITKNGSNKEG